MSSPDPAIDRRLELILDRTLQGLDPVEAAELAELASPDQPDDLTIELAAAAADLASLPSNGAGWPDLPPELAARVEHQAIQFQAHHGPGPRLIPAPDRRLGRVVPWLGWLTAAAAVALLVADRNIAPRPVAVVDPIPSVAADPLRLAPRVQFVTSTHPLARGASGSLAWDNDRQEGSLRVAGLAPVDPGSGCYQLWIFDRSRDERYPIDGGIFTVPRPSPGRAADQVVAIHPRVPVRAATLFAITLEPPGGVVVSDRERVLLTADWGPPRPDRPPAPARRAAR